MSEFKPKKVEKFKHKDGEIIVEYFLDQKDLKNFGIETINVEQQTDDITFSYDCPVFRSKNNNGLEVGTHDEKSFIVNDQHLNW